MAHCIVSQCQGDGNTGGMLKTTAENGKVSEGLGLHHVDDGEARLAAFGVCNAPPPPYVISVPGITRE